MSFGRRISLAFAETLRMSWCRASCRMMLSSDGWDMKVTAAEFIKNYGRLADQALAEPVIITKNGHDRLVVLSAGEYERLKRRDRRVVTAGELSEAEIALIAKAEVPAEHAHLDEELGDWRR